MKADSRSKCAVVLEESVQEPHEDAAFPRTPKQWHPTRVTISVVGLRGIAPGLMIQEDGTTNLTNHTNLKSAPGSVRDVTDRM